MTNNSERLAVLETKVDVLGSDICEIKTDMKEHMIASQKNTDKISARIDYILWALLVGCVAILAKMVFF